jgi:hypothetical protein
MTRKKIFKATLFILIAGLLLCASSGVAGAFSIPTLPPHAFYGDLNIMGSGPAPAETKVEVRGTGVTIGLEGNPIFTSEAGKYGTSGPTGAKLIAKGDDTLVNGTTLTFYVNDVPTGQTFTWQEGEVTKLDLLAPADAAPPPPPAPTGFVGGPPPPELETNLLGTEETFSISSTGRISSTICITSPDEIIVVCFLAGTYARDQFGDPLSSFTVDVDQDPPCSVPEDERIIGLAYDFQPDGATFNPPIEIVFTYSPADIKEGILEEDLILAFCDEDAGVWVPVPVVINAEDNTITAQIANFTTFAIMGKVIEVIKPVPEPTPLPTPEPTPPAAFSLKSMSILPAEVNPRETVTISVIITNTGGQAGSHDVILKVNGIREDSKTVSLAAGESTEISFKTSRDKAGTYNIECDGIPGSFVVREVIPPPVVTPAPVTPVPVEEPQVNWWIWGGVIAAVIVVGSIIGFLVYRRRGEVKP